MWKLIFFKNGLYIPRDIQKKVAGILRSEIYASSWDSEDNRDYILINTQFKISQIDKILDNSKYSSIYDYCIRSRKQDWKFAKKKIRKVADHHQADDEPKT